MSETKKNITSQVLEEVPVLQKAKGFWDKYSKPISIVSILLIVVFGGWYYYTNYVVEPKQIKAEEAIYKAEEYFGIDSLDKALNGDGSTPGMLKIISKFDGTPTANRAHYFAGAIYLKKEDFKNAIKHLEAFKANGATQVEISAYKMLGDAYMMNNQKEKGAESYKKAGMLDSKDDKLSPDCLYFAGMAYESIGKTKEAIEVWNLLKDRFPNTYRGSNADKYLGRLGVNKDE